MVLIEKSKAWIIGLLVAALTLVVVVFSGTPVWATPVVEITVNASAGTFHARAQLGEGRTPINTNSWEYFISTTDPTCSSGTYTGTGNQVTLSASQRNSLQYICFKVASSDGSSTGYAKASMPKETVPPVVTVSWNSTTYTATASSSDGQLKAGTWKRKAFRSSARCSVETSTLYTSGQTVTLSSDQRRSGWTICFKVEDKAGNTGYGSYIYEDRFPPIITTSISGNTVTASSTDDDIDARNWYHLVTTTNPGSTCPESGNYQDGQSVTLTSKQRETTQYVCFTVPDLSANSGYSDPRVVPPLDTTAPTITASVSGNTVTASSTANDLKSNTWKHYVKSGGSAPTCNSSLSYSGSGSTYTRTGKGLEHVCFTVSDTSGNAGYSSVVTLAAVTTPNPGPNPNPTPNPNTPQNPSTNPDNTPNPNTNPDSSTNNSNQSTTPSTTTNPAPGSNTRDRNPAPNTSPDANNQTPRETSTPGSNTTSEVSQGDGSNNATNPATTPAMPETNQEDSSVTTQNVDTAQTTDTTPDQDDSKKTSSKKDGLSSLDYLGLGVIAAITTAIIIIFVKKQRSTTEAADSDD